MLLLQVEYGEVLNVVEAVLHLIQQAAAEDALLLHVAAPIARELDDFDLGATKPHARIIGEEQQPDMARHFVVVDPHDQAHASVDFAGVRLVQQAAANLAQELAHFRFAHVFHSGRALRAVVPRHSRGLLDQAAQQVATPFRIHGFAAPATNP